MKKKLLIGILFGFFAVFTVLSINPTVKNGEISLDNISIMAKASAEDDNTCPNGCYPCGNFCHCYRDYYWYLEAGN
jgi:hypothetical protein